MPKVLFLKEHWVSDAGKLLESSSLLQLLSSPRTTLHPHPWTDAPTFAKPCIAAQACTVATCRCPCFPCPPALWVGITPALGKKTPDIRFLAHFDLRNYRQEDVCVGKGRHGSAQVGSSPRPWGPAGSSSRSQCRCSSGKSPSSGFGRVPGSSLVLHCSPWKQRVLYHLRVSPRNRYRAFGCTRCCVQPKLFACWQWGFTGFLSLARAAQHSVRKAEVL